MAAHRPGPAGEAGGKRLNSEIYWLAAVILLAVVLRVIVALSRDMLQLDEVSYVRMADNLLLGNAPWDITGLSATHYAILYPFIVAAIAVITRDTVSAGYAVSILFSSLLILPTFMFGKVMWNRRVAIAAAALVAVMPVLIAAGSTIDSHNVFAFWLFCALFFGYRMQFTKRCLCGMLAGTCLGLAFLSDPSALFYLVILLVMLVVVGIRQEVASYANKAAAQFVLLFFIFAIPGLIWMTYQTGNFTISDRPVDQVYATVHDLRPGTIEYEKEMMGVGSDGEISAVAIRDGKGFFESLIDDPGATVWGAARSAYNDYFRGAQAIIPVWLLPLIGLGMFKVVWTRREALKYAYFAIVMLPLLILPAMWGDRRYLLPYMGVAMLLIAKGWMSLEEWSIGTTEEISGAQELSRGGRRRVQVAVAALVIVPLVALSMWNAYRTEYPVQYKQAGEWLEGRGDEDVRVMSREPSTAFYAGGDLVELPYATPEETIDYGRSHGADYLVLSRSLVETLRPQLTELLDTGGRIIPGVEEVYHSGEGTDGEL
ncbi:MAG TPA: hypothetical protein ENH44_03865, partial [Actinobacteria bacterium]|nr:hypothetical protein [Actinomycetota bacterium]